MFKFSKRKMQVAAPVRGKILDIIEVNDEMFSAKMLGDGFAVEPEADIITAPCNGEVVFLADTLHAIVIETEKVQILIHIGLDTVELGGKGFHNFIQVGDYVVKGASLICINREYIQNQGKSLTTMVVITNMAEKVKSMEKDLDNENAVLTVQMK